MMGSRGASVTNREQPARARAASGRSEGRGQQGTRKQTCEARPVRDRPCIGGLCVTALRLLTPNLTQPSFAAPTIAILHSSTHPSTRPLASLTQRGIGYVRRWKLKSGILETSLSVDAASGELEIQQPRPAHSVPWSWHRGLDLRLPMAFRFASQILSGMATMAGDRSSLSWRCGWNEMASPRMPGSSPPQGPPPWSISLLMVSARRS